MCTLCIWTYCVSSLFLQVLTMHKIIFDIGHIHELQPLLLSQWCWRPWAKSPGILPLPYKQRHSQVRWRDDAPHSGLFGWPCQGETKPLAPTQKETKWCELISISDTAHTYVLRCSLRTLYSVYSHILQAASLKEWPAAISQSGSQVYVYKATPKYKPPKYYGYLKPCPL